LAKVSKYIPNRRFGFIEDAQGSSVFFHISTFDSKGFEIPPIAGEEIELLLDDSDLSRAASVLRVNDPQKIRGVIDTINQSKGYGFIKGEDDQTYYLHKSELLPEIGALQTTDRVEFYVGSSRGRPKACYITKTGEAP
jgi:cold shock CspA family protein